MRRMFAFFIFLGMVLTIFVGCQSADNTLINVPLSQETKDAVDRAVLDLGCSGIYWDFPQFYYGTINGCIIVNGNNLDYMHVAMFCKIKVGDYEFCWGNPIDLYAFKDGKACTLEDAYREGWLNDNHIQQLYDHHENFRTNYGKYLMEWRAAREETQGD